MSEYRYWYAIPIPVKKWIILSQLLLLRCQNLTEGFGFFAKLLIVLCGNAGSVDVNNGNHE